MSTSQFHVRAGCPQCLTTAAARWNAANAPLPVGVKCWPWGRDGEERLGLAESAAVLDGRIKVLTELPGTEGGLWIPLEDVEPLGGEPA